MSTTRPYRSALRVEQADETRLRIRRSAAELFADQGVSRTTVAQIATAAGVATQTVYGTYRSKAGLIRALLDDLEDSSDIDGWMLSIRAEHDSRRQLALLVAWNRSLFEQGTSILRALLAVRGDPDVGAMADEGDLHRMNSSREFAQVWADRGDLCAGISVDDATERLWMLTSPEQYLLGVDRLGWTPDRYERWLVAVLEADLLVPKLD